MPMQGRRRVPRGLPDSVLRAQESLNQEPLGFLLRLEPPNPSRRLVGFIISDLVQTGWLPAKWFCAALQGMLRGLLLALADMLDVFVVGIVTCDRRPEFLIVAKPESHLIRLCINCSASKRGPLDPGLALAECVTTARLIPPAQRRHPVSWGAAVNSCN
uniref:Uncharacterized protein n=1 Tax=Rangifer tarandus platyrhynchus TaxID=3082113 RepID=A0ACB0E8K2_RANTA|nr:unnamed protein product [Rangifer tarandus platyrhynchus]